MSFLRDLLTTPSFLRDLLTTPTYVAIGIGSVLVVLLLLGCVLVFPRLLIRDLPDVSLRDVTKKKRIALQTDRLRVQTDTRTGLLQGLGGAALIAGLVFTWYQFSAQQDLTRRGQIADRFSKAIDQVGQSAPDKLDVRLGGIYGLEQTARDAGDERTRLATYEVLTAYVREHAIWDPNSPPVACVPGVPSQATITPSNELQMRAPDIQAAMTVLGRRGKSESDPPIDLHGADLRGARLGRVYGYTLLSHLVRQPPGGTRG